LRRTAATPLNGHDLGERPEQHGLEAKRDHGRSYDQGVLCQHNPTDLDIDEKQDGGCQQTDDENYKSRVEEDSPWAQQKKEAQASPPIPPAPQMRGATATVG
jgi:hypothetical protein